MSRTLKASALGFLAMIAVGAIAVINASATPGGHFVSEQAHTDIVGLEGPGDHRIHLEDLALLTKQIGCNNVSYLGTISAATVESVTITPSYTACYTTGAGTPGDVTVTTNGCTYTFKVAAKTIDTTNQTAHLICPTGKKIEIHHPACTYDIHPQTISKELTYKTATDAATGKHEITVGLVIDLEATRHGMCQLSLPTNGHVVLDGSATVRGAQTAGGQISITAT